MEIVTGRGGKLTNRWGDVIQRDRKGGSGARGEGDAEDRA